MIKRKKEDKNPSSRRADDARKAMFDAEDSAALAKAVKQARETDKRSRRAKTESNKLKKSFDTIIKKNF